MNKTFNDLNFPSFNIMLKFWFEHRDILRKWKTEDDWEWWWVCKDGKNEIFNKEKTRKVYERMFVPFFEPLPFAIPCPSLGEMMERLYFKGCSLDKNWEDWHIHSFSGTILSRSDTAPNAVAKGLIEVNK